MTLPPEWVKALASREVIVLWDSEFLLVLPENREKDLENVFRGAMKGVVGADND